MTSDSKVCTACGSPSKLRCPTCMKLNIVDGSHFCSQDCFKASWGTHKAIHQTAAAAVSNGTVNVFNPWPSFRYTGKMRPVYPLSPTRSVPDNIPKPDYAADGKPWSELALKGSTQIEVLTPDEIEKMRVACRISREVLNEGRKAVKVGATTDEIDRVVHEACIERGAYPSPLNYYGFPKSCCTSVNEVICHGIPDRYEIQDGDIVNLDVSCMYDGFHGDLNETYCVGNVDDRGRQLVANTRACLDKAIAAVKPGVLYRDMGNIIQKVAQAEGFSVVRAYCGHGIHRYFHTTPNVPHYAKNKAVGVMKPGHTFTIEPMISEGTWHDEQWPDSWTAVTKDGKRSAQFEETLLVTETGCELLTGDFTK
ncbi:peptidase M24, structural domain-containing protein [Fimicolochytrium jonesii]|uniref:peptidase M24, structural domain-containing protein n=1 Tax=Fimicolochytrium jonesii TaxID=1396493 RepID=UPI0022FED6B4|nr:peptidase M24, structural domain-containing protein [Fimicolochytrium jonesii]KAI8816675.1 peptidase M24, structural domain-containing protein [Fimicolochytrium jonesii]